MTHVPVLTAVRPEVLSRQDPPGLPSLALGAGLYVPCTHPDLARIVQGERYALRTVILCTEDAVHERDLPDALARLRDALSALPGRTNGPAVYVRPRGAAVLREILGMRGAAHLQGYVLPKVTASAVPAYRDVLGREALHVTLETAEAFSDRETETLRDVLLGSGLNVQGVRVGGNDLLALLGLRRERGVTLAHTPLARVIERLVAAYRPYGLGVSAPVYDHLDDPATLRAEVQEDLRRGTCGKTAVHPRQISVIEEGYRVSADDLEAARAILAPDAPAVFRHGGMMCEPATHRPWASGILARHELFGLQAETT